jgi:hypothetical protein
MTQWPKDPKSKEIGIWNNQNMTAWLSGFSMALFTRGLGWSAEEAEGYIVNVRKDILNTKIHS